MRTTFEEATKVVAYVMEKLEERGADLQDFGGQTCDEIAAELMVVEEGETLTLDIGKVSIEQGQDLSHELFLIETQLHSMSEQLNEAGASGELLGLVGDAAFALAKVSVALINGGKVDLPIGKGLNGIPY
jgi:hypothetical protein